MRVRHHSTEEFIVSILHSLWHRRVESAVQVEPDSSTKECFQSLQAMTPIDGQKCEDLLTFAFDLFLLSFHLFFSCYFYRIYAPHLTFVCSQLWAVAERPPDVTWQWIFNADRQLSRDCALELRQTSYCGSLRGGGRRDISTTFQRRIAIGSSVTTHFMSVHHNDLELWSFGLA